MVGTFRKGLHSGILSPQTPLDRVNRLLGLPGAAGPGQHIPKGYLGVLDTGPISMIPCKICMSVSI